MLAIAGLDHVAGNSPLAALPDTVTGFVFPRHPALDGWARWDSAHYIAVARYGYGDPRSPSPDGGIGFFPCIPN